MANDDRLNELLDLVEQARAEGDSETEAKAIAAYKAESVAPSRKANPGRHAESSLYTPERADNYRQKAYNDATGYWKGGVRAAEQGAMLASGAAAEGAGLLTEAGARTRRFFGLGNPDPKAQREAVTEALTYQPRTPGAAQGVAEGMKPINDLISPIAEAMGAEKRRFEGTPILQDLYAAPYVAGEALMYGFAPGAKLRAGAKTATAANKSADAIRAAGSVAPVAKAAGFKTTPSAVAGSRSVQPKGMAAHLEGMTGASKASLENAPQYNKLFANEKGVKVDADGRIEPAAYDEARTPAFKVYEEGKNLPGGQNSQYTNSVKNALSQMDIPTGAQPEVDRLLMKYATVGDSAQLVEDLKNLRRNASKRKEGDTASQVESEAIADFQMAIADQLENELARRAATTGDEGFLGRLQSARKDLAQLYEAERATNGGYIDVTKLAERQKKHGRLTGTLQLGAEMGENMPSVFQSPQDAARAVAMGGRPPEASSGRAFVNRMIERLGGNALSNRSMRKFNEQIPVGPYALDRFGISPVSERGSSLMGPNSGPKPQVGPPKPGPSSPYHPPLSLAPDAPPGFYNGNPKVADPRSRLAEAVALRVEGDTGAMAPIDSFNQDVIPWEPPGKVPPLRGPTMSMQDQIGPVNPLLAEALAGGDAGIPVPPRGINEAQLSSPAPDINAPRLSQPVDRLGNNATIQAIFEWLASQRK